jgi:hypothetical protein
MPYPIVDTVGVAGGADDTDDALSEPASESESESESESSSESIPSSPSALATSGSIIILLAFKAVPPSSIGKIIFGGPILPSPLLPAPPVLLPPLIAFLGDDGEYHHCRNFKLSSEMGRELWMVERRRDRMAERIESRTRRGKERL